MGDTGCKEEIGDMKEKGNDNEGGKKNQGDKGKSHSCRNHGSIYAGSHTGCKSCAVGRCVGGIAHV